MRRKSMLVFLLPLFIFCAFAFAPFKTVYAKELGITALNVAVLPPVVTDKYASNANIIPVLSKVARHFRYPYYELVSPGMTYDALLSLGFNFESGKPYSEEIIKKVSEELSADIVVVMELAKVRSRVYERGWFYNKEIYRETEVVLNCYTYSAQSGQYHKATASAHSNDLLSFSGSLDTVLPELTAKVLNKTPYKTIPE